jgi:hypothetical protein
MYVYVCIALFVLEYKITNPQAGECIELTDDGVSSYVLAYDRRITDKKTGAKRLGLHSPG